MKIKQNLMFCLIACMVLGLTGCGNSTAQREESSQEKTEGLENLGEITVISREEGSGTRDTFAVLADFTTKDAQSDQKDMTTEEAVVVNDASEVIREVENWEGAIGYLSAGSLQNETGIKKLSVDGVSLEETGRYPLERSFYLSYCGKLSELEQDFLTYVKSKGQELVGEDYIPVAKSNTFLSNKANGTIKIAGSTSVAPLMEKLADAYMEINPNATIVIEPTDSTDGLTQAMSGTCDFGMSSRELKDYETELLDYELIARDQIAVIVNEKNPLNSITLENLKSIYVGDMKKWQELNQ